MKKYSNIDGTYVSHKLTEVNIIAQFLMGDNATFSFHNTRTGNQFTYKVHRAEKNKGPYFVSVLTPEMHYTYIGTIWHNLGFKHGIKSKIGPDAPSVVIFKWLNNRILIQKMKLPEHLEFYHSGECCKCGRELTRVESIKQGIGPHCYKMISSR